MTGRFWNNPSFVQYEELLQRLHGLMAAGQGNGEAAEAVRNDVDILWRHLSEEERARLRGLSADLYMIEGDEVFEPGAADERSPDTLKADLEEAWRGERWGDLLVLLRKGGVFGAPDHVARLRARAYQELGHREVARLFMEYAASLQPAAAANLPGPGQPAGGLRWE